MTKEDEIIENARAHMGNFPVYIENDVHHRFYGYRSMNQWFKELLHILGETQA